MSNLITARSGFNTVLSLSTAGSTGTFSAVAGIVDLQAPKKTLGIIDITYHGTTDGYDIAIPGGIFRQADLNINGLMITCSSFFSYTSAYTILDMRTWMEADTRIGWKIEIGGTSSMNCYYGDGYITAWGLETPFNDVARFTATISPTGKPVFADSTTT